MHVGLFLAAVAENLQLGGVLAELVDEVGNDGTALEPWPDFIRKLREDPSELEILGDGRQEKSYMHVSECVDAMAYAVEHADGSHNVFNLGTRTTTSVDRIADIVADEVGLDPSYEHTGGDRGWTGDVPRMRLSIEKLSGLGWQPAQSSDDAVRQSTRELLAEL